MRGIEQQQDSPAAEHRFKPAVRVSDKHLGRCHMRLLQGRSGCLRGRNKHAARTRACSGAALSLATLYRPSPNGQSAMVRKRMKNWAFCAKYMIPNQSLCH